MHRTLQLSHHTENKLVSDKAEDSHGVTHTTSEQTGLTELPELEQMKSLSTGEDALLWAGGGVGGGRNQGEQKTNTLQLA